MRRFLGVAAFVGLILAAEAEDPWDRTQRGSRFERAAGVAAATFDDRAASGPPVFVVGFQRSGTSLLRSMLNEHPQLAVSMDSQFIPRFWDHRARYTDGDRLDARRLVTDVLASPRVLGWGLSDALVSAHLDGIEAPTFGDAIGAVFRAYADSMGKARWGDKTPGYVLRIPLLAALFPLARFVHIVRDGRDATLSCLRNGVVASTVASGADLWARRVGAGRRDGRALGSGRYLEVRYEDLVSDPTLELTRVCDFLDLGFDGRMLGYTEHALAGFPSRLRSRHENLAKPPTVGIHDWRREMAPADVAAFQAVAGALLDDLGYEQGVDRIPVSARLRARRQVTAAHLHGFGKRALGKARGGSSRSVDGRR